MAWDGRKGEPTMLNLPKRIYIKEVGPRDGLQIEKTFVPTATKIEMIDRLSQCGFADIQSAAFVHPKAVPNMADAEEVLAGITRQPGVEYSALVPNLRGFQRAAAAGVKRVELTLSATDSHNINNMNMWVWRSRSAARLKAYRRSPALNLCWISSLPWASRRSALGIPRA